MIEPTILRSRRQRRFISTNRQTTMNDTFIQNLQQLELSEVAQNLLAQAVSPSAYIRALRDQGLCGDAIRALPHLLPARTAIWWGSLCVWDAQRDSTDPRRHLAMEAVVQWTQLPSETNRRTCEHFGRLLGLGVSTGALAMAVFWSGGSMSAPDLPHVDPPPALAAQVIGGTVQLAAVERDAVHYLDRYRQFLALGLEIASGRNLWTPSGTLADRPERPRAPYAGSRLLERLQVLHSGRHGLAGPHIVPRTSVLNPGTSPSLSAHEVLR